MEIKKSLTATEMNTLYNIVITSLYDEEDEYMYQFADFIWRKAVLSIYTDIEIPDDIDEAYALCRDKNTWNVVMDEIDYDQLCDVEYAIRSYATDKERRKEAGMQFHSLMEDMQKIMTAIGNFENLPLWLANKKDATKSALLKKG